MCFHFKQSKSDKQFREKNFNGRPLKGIYNGFGFPAVTTVADDDPYFLKKMNWGLIPNWAKTDGIRKFTLNARYETINTKPSFKMARRCLIFTDGFFEWKWLDNKGRRKQKYLVEYPSSELFAFAGLYDNWMNTLTGEIMTTCCIVTTEAIGIMREIHNSKYRMPITLNEYQQEKWLSKKEIDFFSDFKTHKL